MCIRDRSDGEACAELVCDLVCRRLPQSYGFDPFEDIQVLCPSKIGPLGTVALNAALQQRLNPPGPGRPQIQVRDKILRVGDKVMQIKNNYDIPYTCLLYTSWWFPSFRELPSVLPAVPSASSCISWPQEHL